MSTVQILKHSHIVRVKLLLLVLVGGWSHLSIAAVNKNSEQLEKPVTEFVIAYISFKDDSHYAERRKYTGLSLAEIKRPLAGIQVGLRESRILARTIGKKLTLQEIFLDSESDFTREFLIKMKQYQSMVAIVDLPRNALLKLVNHVKAEPVLLMNVRSKETDLRTEYCQSNLFHIVPSYAMLMDALNQFIKLRKWSKVLVLEGATDGDRVLSQAYQASAKKYNISIVDVKPFVLSNNPKDRNKTNVALLTGRPKHDIVFIADNFGEFARYVPYQTFFSRYVIGSEGLKPSAWHWTFERYGAPQLNQRFRKIHQSNMSAEEWAGWAAVKAIAGVLKLQENHEFSEIVKGMLSSELSLDLYKGVPGNFRPWNNQLRQPILLHTHNAVVDLAPIDGFLHQHNNLDSLGADLSETDCSGA